MQPAYIEYYNESDYLAAEREAPFRHEYVAGEVFAMAGASKVHGTLALNAAIVLRQHLRGNPCRVWVADMKVRVKADSAYYYPDVVATCDATDLSPEAPKDYVEAPKLVLEVLSDSTESVDRREKLLSYRRLPSLEEYVLIDQNKPWVEVYRHTPAGWVQEVYEAGDVVRFVSIDLAVPLEELYADSGIEMVKVCPE